jgi:hypothetical protein
LANTEAGLQNSQDAVDEEDYVGDTQIDSASDTTFPQGNLYSSEHKSVVFKKRVRCLPAFMSHQKNVAFVRQGLTA